MLSSFVVSDGLESMFSGLKRKKKKPVSGLGTYNEQMCVCVCIYMLAAVINFDGWCDCRLKSVP